MKKICEWCEVELQDDECIETINDEILCYGCDCKRLINEQ